MCSVILKIGTLFLCKQNNVDIVFVIFFLPILGCELPKKHIAEKKWIEKDGYNLPSQFNCEKGVNYFF